MITDKTIIWLRSYIKEIYVLYLKTYLILFHFWVTFLWVSAQHYKKVVSTLTQLSSLTKYQRWNSTGSSTLNRRNSFNVVSTLFCQRWNNVNKRALAQLSFSTKYQRWDNIGSSTLMRHISKDAVSTLFCQRWNNVNKCTSAQLSFSTKYQRWSNVDKRWRSTLFQRWFNVDVFTG